MNVEKINAQLHALRNKNWPKEWGAREEAEIGDYFGWCHRYRLEDPLPETEISAFERQYQVFLPEDYRLFLTQLGNGGAGPYYGIYSLAELEEGPVPLEILMNLKEDFTLTGFWNGSEDITHPANEGIEPDLAYYSDTVMQGALPIATQGCALDYWMVVTGVSKGEIWLDSRADGLGVASVTDQSGNPLTFGPWYQAWLDEASEKWGCDTR